MRQATLALLLALVPESIPIQSPEPIAPLQQPPIERFKASAIRKEPDTTEQFPSRLATERISSPAKISIPLPEKVTDAIAKVAIIIDDMGYNREVGLQLLNLELPLNFSFLPQAPHTEELAWLAHERGRTVLVHLPMEPQDHSWKNEPLTLRVGETEDQLQEKTWRMLAAVPTATGANNHMGSRFTQHHKEIRQVLSTLREQGLFFIDSYTIAGSVAEATARKLGIPTARRRIFLDNDQQESAICRQMVLLADLAIQKGEAIAIGHPNQGMVAAFAHCAPTRLAKVQLVSVEQVVNPSPPRP
ncbi:MAG: divergent polysaccharide deacetylase family protein [Desulfobulbus sp.]